MAIGSDLKWRGSLAKGQFLRACLRHGELSFLIWVDLYPTGFLGQQILQDFPFDEADIKIEILKIPYYALLCL